MTRIKIINTNEGKPNTCGSCKHTDNKLGVVALHCDLLEGEEYDWGKVRSWNKCQFKPSMYEKRQNTFEQECKKAGCHCPPEHERKSIIANTPHWLRLWFVHEYNQKRIEDMDDEQLIDELMKLMGTAQLIDALTLFKKDFIKKKLVKNIIQDELCYKDKKCSKRDCYGCKILKRLRI